MFKVTNKDTRTTSITYVRLLSLLLNLNVFHTLFKCFNCWLCACIFFSWERFLLQIFLTLPTKQLHVQSQHEKIETLEKGAKFVES